MLSPEAQMLAQIVQSQPGQSQELLQYLQMQPQNAMDYDPSLDSALSQEPGDPRSTPIGRPMKMDMRDRRLKTNGDKYTKQIFKTKPVMTPKNDPFLSDEIRMHAREDNGYVGL